MICVKFFIYVISAGGILSSSQDCSVLQIDSDTIRNWCKSNHMKLNVSKIIRLLGKRIWILLSKNYVDIVLYARITIKDFEVFLNSKLDFH
jgi:intein-encoded DNA endonuclease-like protein